jgi:hypothetical protein
VTGSWAVIPAPNTPPPDATRIFTCRSSNGASVAAAVTLK